MMRACESQDGRLENGWLIRTHPTLTRAETLAYAIPLWGLRRSGLPLVRVSQVSTGGAGNYR